MTIKRVVAAVIGIWGLTIPAGCKGKTSGDNKTSASSRAVGEPDRSDELKQFFVNMQEAVRNRDKARAKTLARSLEPRPLWFAETFGPGLGKKLADGLAPKRNQYEQLPLLVRGQLDSGKTAVSVERYAEPSPQATVHQCYQLRLMIQPTALYSVRFFQPGSDRGHHLWSFIYDQGAFRFAGKMVEHLPADKRTPQLERRGGQHPACRVKK